MNYFGSQRYSQLCPASYYIYLVAIHLWHYLICKIYAEIGPILKEARFFYVADLSTFLVRSSSWQLPGAQDDCEHLLTSCKKLKSVCQRCSFYFS